LSDRNTCVLFGDAAGAMVVGLARDPGAASCRRIFIRRNRR
jgi:3-oxoacyl-[acyl-carrier-protein] synthase III